MTDNNILNDLPTIEDRLNWDAPLERIAKRIRECQPPYVLGIHGDWGSGKTSFMRQLQQLLGGDIPKDGSIQGKREEGQFQKDKALRKEIATVWFDAWRYQNEAVPVVALLQEMRRQLGALPAIKEKFNKLGEITLRYTLNAFADAGKLIGFEGLPSGEKIVAVGEGWEKDHLAQTLPSDSIREHLHQTMTCLLPSEEARVVVFIDDLDRCNPKAAIRLLEGLKIYLTIPNCVFVLGMNERILIDAIGEELSVPKEAQAVETVRQLRAAHYLEKICSDIYRLPLPTKPGELFANWLPELHKPVLLHFFDIDSFLWGGRCLPPNPRRLKALANQWTHFADKLVFPSELVEQQAWAVRVLVAAYIHQFHRDLWERWHFNPDFWEELKAWCQGKYLAGTTPKWAEALKFTEQVTEIGDALNPTAWKTDFPNPGDIDLFWLDGLIRRYSDILTAQDFIPLLNKETA